MPARRFVTDGTSLPFGVVKQSAVVTLDAVTEWRAVTENSDPDPSTIAGLRELVGVQRDTIVAIATGTSMATLREGYLRRRSSLRSALISRALSDPFPWEDVDLVWAWAKQWPRYAERRAEVAKRVTPLLDQLDDLERLGNVDDWGGSPAEWSRLEERLSGLRDELGSAATLDQYQDVGRRCREINIDVVNLVFAADMVPDGQEHPKSADAKARFDLILQARAIGTTHAELRKLMRAGWDLAQKATHGDVTRVDAFAAAQATVLLVRTLAEMQRNHSSE